MFSDIAHSPSVMFSIVIFIGLISFGLIAISSRKVSKNIKNSPDENDTKIIKLTPTKVVTKVIDLKNHKTKNASSKS